MTSIRKFDRIISTAKKKKKPLKIKKKIIRVLECKIFSLYIQNVTFCIQEKGIYTTYK